MKRTIEPLKRNVGSLTIAVTLAAGAVAYAAWGGQLDGDQHPMVGAMYADFNANGTIEWFEIICSGSYAGPAKDGASDVFLTAGHCVAPLVMGGVTAFWVSFDGDPRDGVGRPENPIAAAAFAWDPRFGHDVGNLYDSAVLLLPAGSVPDLPAVSLPPAGYLDGLKASGDLQHMEVELVGYGVVPVWQQRRGTQFLFDGRRRTSISEVKGITLAWLRFNQTAEATDLGGLCFGDSGSPQFVPGTNMIVSTTTGGDPNCRANNFNYRLDTVGARQFLGRFLNLP
jgi:hypothetical protein